MPLVIDASVALTWIYRDEASANTDALFDRVVLEGALVPALFHLEVANALLQGERRGRITPSYTGERLAVLGRLRLDVDPGSESAWSNTITLGRIERLTAYDAAYLELALRRGAELATLDAKLADAAKSRGVTVHSKNPP